MDPSRLLEKLEDEGIRPTTPMKKILSGTIRKNMDLTDKVALSKTTMDFKTNLGLIEKKIQMGNEATCSDRTKRIIEEMCPNISAESMEDLQKALEEAKTDEKKLNTATPPNEQAKQEASSKIKIKQVHFAKPSSTTGEFHDQADGTFSASTVMPRPPHALYPADIMMTINNCC
jgi:(p)ppGpp synthase/HD superfamily hydrolase